MRVWPLLVIAALLSSCSTTERAHTDAELSQLVARASQDRAHLVKRFAAPHGFIGVIVQGNDPGARQTTGWVTAGGEYLLVGSLFDAHGRNVADAPLGQRGSGGLTSQEFMRRVQAAEAVTQFPTGTGTLSIFADADCVFCWQLFEEVSRFSDEIRERSVRLRWIMVGTQSAQSARRSAAILKQGLAGLAENEENYNRAQSVGAIAPIDDAYLLSVVTENTELLFQSPTSTTATPTLVWQSSRGVQTYVGAPDEKTLREILGEIQRDHAQP